MRKDDIRNPGVALVFSKDNPGVAITGPAASCSGDKRRDHDRFVLEQQDLLVDAPIFNDLPPCPAGVSRAALSA